MSSYGRLAYPLETLWRHGATHVVMERSARRSLAVFISTLEPNELMCSLVVITDPKVARQSLECLALPSRPPQRAPANEIDLEPVVGHVPIYEIEPSGGDEKSA